jgi:hypothetical protein
LIADSRTRETDSFLAASLNGRRYEFSAFAGLQHQAAGMRFPVSGDDLALGYWQLRSFDLA